MFVHPESFGGIGEMVLREWLKGMGYALIPTTLIENGGAPVLESDIEKLILPDFLAFGPSLKMFVDAKSKRRAAYHQKLKRFSTGCALRHYRAYQKVAQMTEIPGALAFLHVESRTLDLGMLDWIDGDSHIWRKPSNHPRDHAYKEDMIFFDLARFEQYSLESCRLFAKLKDASVPAKIVRQWEVNKTPPQMRQGFLF